MERVHGDVAVELRHHALGPLREALGVLRRPPVAQVALGVKLAPLVVEAVRELVADHRPDAAVVHGVVRRGVEVRGLQDPGGKDDLVERGVVVRVHCGRGHAPLGPVDGPAHLGELALLLELARPQHVRAVGPGAPGLERRVIAPGVGVPDLLEHRIELPVGLGLGRVAHPAEPPDALGQRALQVVDDVQHVRFGGGRELAGHVRLAEGLP